MFVAFQRQFQIHKLLGNVLSSIFNEFCVLGSCLSFMSTGSAFTSSVVNRKE